MHLGWQSWIGECQRFGETLCHKLRAKDRQEALYLILLTSRGAREDVVRGLEAGADDYITKPYDIEELRARIKVGRRILALQNELRKQEKLEGVLEMAGAVCHALNQPLQSVSGFSELIMMDVDESDPQYHNLKTIKEEIDRIGKLTRKIMKISKYRVKGYLDGKMKIIDIENAAQ